jgi:hypothetical protein
MTLFLFLDRGKLLPEIEPVIRILFLKTQMDRGQPLLWSELIECGSG